MVRTDTMHVIHARAAGLDVHKDADHGHGARGPPRRRGAGADPPVQRLAQRPGRARRLAAPATR